MFGVPMTNVEASRTRYRIDDARHVELRRVLRGAIPALSIVGIYHSHPAGGAAASASDIAEAMYPDWTYVIVGLAAGRVRVRGFRIRNGCAREVVLRAR